MRFLIDECLHESLVEVAHTAGHDAMHVNHLGLSGQPDWTLGERILRDEFTFVTNNRVDFIQLFSRMDLHAGLIVLVPNVTPALQRALFLAALQFSAQRDLVNAVIEVELKGGTARCVQYELPADRL
jgi:predicted nuclease of predicted toxin-antitoxin system